MKLEIKKLTKNYSEKEIFNDTSFTFDEGKIYGLLGRNGAGKTTFFNILNQDTTKDTGTILLDNANLDIKDIGYVLSTPTVPEFLTGKEFLQFFLDVQKENIINRKNIDEYFEMVNLSKEDQNTLLKDYSHGMKNKIQILLNIIADYKVILLDEPLTSLDIVALEEMKKLLKDLKKNHIIIFSTHILELALDLCDEIVIINNKKLQVVTKKDLNLKDYKEKILNILKDDNHD